METTYYIMAVYGLFAMLELVTGRFLNRDKTRAGDVWIEVIVSISFVFLIVPFIFLGADFLWQSGAPEARDMLTSWPVAVVVLLFLVGDDMTQYWWHRITHSVPWLYNMHRAHHDVGYMSVRLVYRNNLIYYLFMPGIWVSASLVYLGGGDVYIGYVCVKMTVVIASHSSVRWDEKLYAHPLGAKLMWLVERVISTPSTHAMHHGKHLADGVTHYKGNFGNLLFLWDILFGTAKISRRFPDDYGVENLEPEPWYRLIFLPYTGQGEKTVD